MLTDGAVIETRALSKRYGARPAVDDLHLTVRRGEVYGFLGPNGAGKSTTLRMLLGLIRPSSGSVRIFGSAPGDPEGLARVGALIEAPAFYPYLSGRDNLRVMANYAGVPRARVEAVLELVELSERAGDRFSTYSMGMKQRLGVAAALLKEPELLILDEPTNGLDPRGTVEMRALIRRLGRGERTVLFSSHLLGEVEQIADRVGVIQKGRLVAEGSVAELLGVTGLIVRAAPLPRAREIMENLFGSEKVELAGDALRLAVPPGRSAELTRALIAGGAEVSEVRVRQQSLEELFFQLTENKEVQG